MTLGLYLTTLRNFAFTGKQTSKPVAPLSISEHLYDVLPYLDTLCHAIVKLITKRKTVDPS